jgi:hypothetical protein
MELYTGLTRLAISGHDESEFKVGVKVMINSLQEFSVDELMMLGISMMKRKFDMSGYELVMDGTFQFFDWIKNTTMTTHTLFNSINEIDDRILPFLYANKELADTFVREENEYKNMVHRQEVSNVKIRADGNDDDEEDEFFRALAEQNEDLEEAPLFSNNTNQRAGADINPFVGYNNISDDSDYLAVDVDWKRESLMKLLDNLMAITFAPNNFNELRDMLKKSTTEVIRDGVKEKTIKTTVDVKEFLRMKMKGCSTQAANQSRSNSEQILNDCVIIAPTKIPSEWRQSIMDTLQKEKRVAKVDEDVIKIAEAYIAMAKSTTWFNIRDGGSLKDLNNRLTKAKNLNVLIDEKYWIEHGNVYDVARLVHVMSFNPNAKLYLVKISAGTSSINRGLNGTERRVMSFIYKCKNIKPSLLKNLV